MAYCVYEHIAPNGKRYIGITGRNPLYRWSRGKAYVNNRHFYNAIEKYGWDNIEHIIVADGLTKEQACEMEIALIREYNTTDPAHGFNHSTGGDGGASGMKYSEETIQKRKAHRDYSTSWAKGKKFTPEHCAKISASNRGRVMSPESRKKMSEARMGVKPWCAGKTLDDEHRAKLSTPIICVETKVVYFGIMEAERQTGVTHANICKCLNGQRERAGGFHWQYHSLERAKTNSRRKTP